MNKHSHIHTLQKERESEERMSLREWKYEIPSLQQYVQLHRPEQPSITYLTLALSFSMRLKFILNAPAQQLWSCTCLCCLCGKAGIPFCHCFFRKGVSQGCWLLTVQWSFVVKSWALADEWSQSPLLVEVWSGCSRSWTFAANLTFGHETQRKEKKLK